MKALFPRQPLLDAFQAVAPIAPARTPKPILSSVLLEIDSNGIAKVEATNLEMGAICNAGVATDVASAGCCVLPADQFGQIIRNSQDEFLSIEMNSTNVHVTGSSSSFEVPTAPAAEFPRTTTNGEVQLSVDGKLFAANLRRGTFCIDPKIQSYALGGAMIDVDGDTLVVASADGRRAAESLTPGTVLGPDFHRCVIPAAALAQMRRFLSDDPVDIGSDKASFWLQSGDLYFETRLVQGLFPPYRKVIPDNYATTFSIDIGILLAAVQQAAMTATDITRAIIFQFRNGELILSGDPSHKGRSRVSIPCGHSGEDIELMFDAKYLIDALKVLDPGEEATLAIDPRKSKVFLRAKNWMYMLSTLEKQ
jgi:DNA polymerase-3 subunit beta